jgi:mono/diheme cytochrome c family protein
MGRSRVVALALAGILGGCNWYYNTLPSPDDAVKLVPWFDHMIKSSVISPYSRLDVPRLTPPGTVPVNGGEPEWGTVRLTGPIPVYGFDSLVANRLTNPMAGASIARGDTLYTNFCSVCHGSTGDGKGPVGVRVGALSLLTDKAKALPDGNVYSIIKYGRGNMPLYGDKVFLPRDRWALVNYIRRLQGTTTPGAAQ